MAGDIAEHKVKLQTEGVGLEGGGKGNAGI
jgi:hypothetical protein